MIIQNYKQLILLLAIQQPKDKNLSWKKYIFLFLGRFENLNLIQLQ